MQGDYNDVFALLDNVVFDDEVIVYYGQEKHTYKIKSKEVIRPGDVSVLRSHTDDDRSQITLMTCWPIGTTLNRLVLIGELVKVEK
jgi:LPXTG-site transpeptidase (sortase) family protein